MLEIINHPTVGEIVYGESFWTGRKTLRINGVYATPVSKKEFLFNDVRITVKGSYYTGVTVFYGNEPIEVCPKPKWYEVVLAIIPILFLLTWGNVPELCLIFPVVGGALGGLIGAIFGILSIALMRRSDKPIFKVLIGLGVAALAILTAFLVALIFGILLAGVLASLMAGAMQ